MTIETYNKADCLVHDLKILKDIKYEQDRNHWVGFHTPSDKMIGGFQESKIQDDFKEFIIREIEKANKMLEEL